MIISSKCDSFASLEVYLHDNINEISNITKLEWILHVYNEITLT